jgi:hypothetical protein
MSERPPKAESICERFNAYAWHDSKLFAMHLLHGKEKRTGDLVLDLLLRPKGGREALQASKLIIKDCTILRINLDVEAKAVCSHDIGGAQCRVRSALMDELERRELRYESNPLAGFVHFHLELCPPAGDIHAIARDFEIKVSGDP